MAEEIVEVLIAVLGVAAAAVVGLLRWAALHPRATGALAVVWGLMEVTR